MQTLHRKPFLRKIVAGGLLLMGFMGMVLPVLPGWLFFGLSLYLFSIDSPRIQRIIHRYRTRHRSFDRVLEKTYDRLLAKYAVIENKIEQKIEEAV